MKWDVVIGCAVTPAKHPEGARLVCARREKIPSRVRVKIEDRALAGIAVGWSHTCGRIQCYIPFISSYKEIVIVESF